MNKSFINISFCYRERYRVLSRNQFEVLNAVRKKKASTQREIAVATSLSLGTVSATLRSLKEAGLIASSADANPSEETKGAPDRAHAPAASISAPMITAEGMKQLKPYKVDNAVIMAAGFASRCAPLSYERPKGLFKVRGEVLIERQICQLKEAGIDEIYVVVGYMKELFFYLEDALGVKIVVNDDYYRRNNTSSLYAARYYLRNSYVCSSDNYFTVNPFEDYVHSSYFACEFSEGRTDEWCVELGTHDRIVKYGVGGQDAWYQIGEFYWTRDFSRTYMDLLEAEYDDPEVADMLLDAFFAKHIDKLSATIKRYDTGDILEFDTIGEIKRFDGNFALNMDSRIIENICATLSCSENEIGSFEQIKRGNTNIIFTFECRGETYVYRHPGKGSERVVDRFAEAFAQSKADELGIDGTTVAINPAEGWKIARYVKGCYDFEYGNEAETLRAFSLMHKLHAAHIASPRVFDLAENCKRYRKLIEENDYRSTFNLEELGETVTRVYHFIEADGVEKVMCHNDMCDSNLIASPAAMHVIDWEYAGMADPANDLCSFIVGGEHTHEQVLHLVNLYFGRAPTEAELRHIFGAIAVVSFHWLLWGIYRQSVGHDAGSLLYYWYRYAVDYSRRALDAYAPCGRLALP